MNDLIYTELETSRDRVHFDRGDSTAHRVTWDRRSLAELTGQTIRLEFFVQDADLFALRAE